MEKNEVYEGDCIEVLKGIESNTFSAVVTDPPYGLSNQPDMKEVLRHWLAGDEYEHNGKGFMGKGWDSFVPGPKVWEEVMRVLKPGGHIFSFGGTRTYDLMVTAMRIAGCEIRDKIDYICELENNFDWVYGQGFPKSLNIGKAIDKMAGAEREVVGPYRTPEGQQVLSTYNNWQDDSIKNGKQGRRITMVSIPATEEAKRWEGYGTALKPAHEPVALFTKNGGDKTNIVGEPFLYTAKTSTRERNLGCKSLYWVGEDEGMRLIDEEEYKRLSEENERRKGEEGYIAHKVIQGNPHPTVKPIELMRYLVRMIKMPGENLILDPFCGSGSTLIACILEGCDYIGIDSDPMAAKIAATRTYYFKCLGEKGLK